MKYKRIFLIALSLLVISSVYIAFSEDIYDKPNAYWLSGETGRDTLWEWAQTVDGVVMGNKGTAEIWYADSGVSNEGDGGSVTDAKNTIDEAINLCTANRGDIIYVVQGHAENADAADEFDADVAGISIIGLGVGSLKPTITYTAAAGEIAIGADNVTISNIRFSPATDTVAIGLDIEAGADYAHLINCEFIKTHASPTEFTTTVKLNGNTGTRIEGCKFYAYEASAATAILLENQSTDTTIRNCDIRGDYSDAMISASGTLSTGILIEDNNLYGRVRSGFNTVEAIRTITGCEGIVRRNYITANLGNATQAFASDGLVFFANYYNETVGGSNTAFAFDEIANTATQTLADVDAAIYK